jgi:Acetyltransferase (GNAT) family
MEPGCSDEVVALLRSLHPDWKWLDDRALRDGLLASNEDFERLGFVVRRAEAVIAGIVGSCWRNNGWPRTRRIQIEARPEDIEPEWLDGVLRHFVDADRGQPDAWHVANASTSLAPVLAPFLEAAGFVHYSTQQHMEWEGNFLPPPDPGSARLERYAGGNQDIDKAIVDLYNRSHLPLRLVPPIRLADLLTPWPGLDAREFVLAWEKDRLVGYADCCVSNGEAWISDRTSTRFGIGTAVAIQAGQILLDRGHRKIHLLVQSANKAALRLLRKFGCKVAQELGHTFVLKLDQCCGSLGTASRSFSPVLSLR